MSCTLHTESLTRELIQEVSPLAQCCWDECTEVKGNTCPGRDDRGIKIIPAWDRYQELAKRSALIVLTLRCEGALQGFLAGILYQSIHHKDILCGNVDVFYIVPGYRTYTRSMVRRIEAEFIARGVGMFGWPVSPKSPFYKTLQSFGFRVDDVMMEKRLCVQ